MFLSRLSTFLLISLFIISCGGDLSSSSHPADINTPNHLIISADNENYKVGLPVNISARDRDEITTIDYTECSLDIRLGNAHLVKNTSSLLLIPEDKGILAYTLSCGDLSSGEINKTVQLPELTSVDFYGVSFDAYTGSAYIGETNISGMHEMKYSNDRKTAVITRVIHGRIPDVFTLENGVLTRTTDNIEMKYNPAISNNGDIAYSTISRTEATYPIILNNSIVAESNNGKLSRNSVFIADKLAFANFSSSETKFDLIINDITSDTSVAIEVINAYPELLVSLNDSILLMQVFSLDTESKDVWTYNIDTQQLAKPFSTPDNEFLYRNTANGVSLVAKTSGDINSLLYFNALYEIFSIDLMSPLANGNNYFGGIAWGVQYRIQALTELAKIDANPLWNDMLTNIAQRLLSVQNEDLGLTDGFNPDYSWSSIYYSLDKSTPMTFSVHDGFIYYSLLKACREGLMNQSVCAEAVHNAAATFTAHESEFDSTAGGYKFQYGAPYLFDGVWMPFNQQNTLGLMLLELYRLTGTVAYKDRAFQLAHYLNNDLFILNGSTIWNYWPQNYYDGWSAASGTSVNTPLSSPKDTSVSPGEDTSHAGINIKFIYEFNNLFPGEVFSRAFADSLSTLADSMAASSGYHTYISAEDKVTDYGYKAMPGYGWCTPESAQLKAKLAKSLPRFYLGTNFAHEMLSCIGDEEAGQLNVQVSSYDGSTAEVIDNLEYNRHEMLKFFIR